VRDEQLDPAGMMTMELDRGVHRITLRIDTRARMASDLRLELFKPQGSSIEFTVVVGP